jgi:hypothetical protein
MELRPEMNDAPTAMRGRPIDHRGFYVPWFVTAKDENGHWDFRRVDPNRVREAYQRKVCWISGEPLGSYKSFVIGPMCCINRITAEPPVKREIAEWSVRVCPWLSNPQAKRPLLDEGSFRPAPGLMVMDNPGISCIWTIKGDGYQMNRDRLIRLGDPVHVAFYKNKEKASDLEIREALKIGGRRLMDIAEPEGPEAINLLGMYLMEAAATITKFGGVNLR